MSDASTVKANDITRIVLKTVTPICLSAVEVATQWSSNKLDSPDRTDKLPVPKTLGLQVQCTMQMVFPSV